MEKDEKNRLPFFSFFFHNFVSGLVHLPLHSQAADWPLGLQRNQPETGSPTDKKSKRGKQAQDLVLERPEQY